MEGTVGDYIFRALHTMAVGEKASDQQAPFGWDWVAKITGSGLGGRAGLGSGPRHRDISFPGTVASNSQA